MTHITRRGMYILTAVSAALYIFLTWAFASGQWSLTGGSFWLPADRAGNTSISGSTFITYLLFGLIIAAGVYQARKLPAEGVDIAPKKQTTAGQTDDPVLWKLLLGNAYLSVFWMPLRFFIGRQWLTSGEGKVRNDAWMDGGSQLQGYWQAAVAIPEGQTTSRITYAWYHDFLQYMLDNQWYTWFAKAVAIGEVLIAIGLIVGALVGLAAFFGTLMNFNFMMAGTVSSNPVLFGLGVFLVLAWKVAGYWGLDRYLLPAIGAPWSFGTLFKGGGFRPATPGREALA
jgi:thiosulfate dehydrogenase (quinone) large subunit